MYLALMRADKLVRPYSDLGRDAIPKCGYYD
jgi:hypothetical protein